MDHLARSVPTLTLVESLLFDVFCALAVHKVYSKYEVDPANFTATFLLLVAVPALPSYFLFAQLGPWAFAVLVSYVLFYATLVASIVLYRISPFHPLAEFPGPISLKISKLVTMYHAKRGKQYVFFKSLHDKYGPFVRVGPNEISVADAEAIPPILGLDGTRRGPIWEFNIKPGTTPHIIALRDVNQHRDRRKLWNRAFTSASLKELQPIVENRVLQLAGELGKRVSKNADTGKIVDLAQWMANFTYDFMGDLVFGGGLELMRDGDKDGVRSTIESGLKVKGILQHIAWISPLLFTLPLSPKAQVRYREFVTRRYEMRKRQGSTRRDLFHYITDEDGSGVRMDQGLNETFVAIVGGADTTSTVLGGLFFYLLSNPASLKQLQVEVDSVFPRGEGEPFDAIKLANMPYLNAVINEALRLQPPQPTSLQRSPLQGSGGKWIAGRFVAESTAIYIPTYVLHRDERYFSPSPNSFIPKRWLDNSGKFNTNTAAFIPFSSGPANCVGKNLALLEMRMVVTSLVQKFDMRFAEGYDPGQWERDLRDFFVMKVGKLPAVLAARG